MTELRFSTNYLERVLQWQLVGGKKEFCSLYPMCEVLILAISFHQNRSVDVKCRCISTSLIKDMDIKLKLIQQTVK